ncbi:hypothetical protein I302_106869 [Kwoniella bestiolae CBS 10118]|uniref:RNase III domain-containing protein n=1 Tax=Kwoniella bestiolae CBS 10118 TaxID=1296100 RepID=A0A1B9G068_9TREE|nr:hypothetical protein I302_05865 [Kwoniella bestiolae CBS 10118]OCF24405.1 hypothetical protein I302_05865 [Kwoniella bestiolae CBS 10118]
MPRSTQKYDNSLDTFVLPSLPQLDLPPIPPITDSKLKDMVFTHASLSNLPRSHRTSVFLIKEDRVLDYEKLEHIGDALLEAIAVTLLHELFPNFRQGSASIMRHRLVSNVTLAQVSCQYGLPQLLKSEPSLRYTLKKNEKVQASIFEAYISAVYYSYLGQEDQNTPTPPSSQSISPTGELSGDESTSPSPDKATEEAPSATETDEKSEGSDQEYFDAESTTNISSDSDEEDESTDYYDGIEIIFKELSTDEDTDNSQESPIPSANSSNSPPSSEDADSPTDTHSSQTVKPRKTRGDAYDYLFQWLRQILEPIAHFAVEHLEVEEKRIQKKYRRVPETVFVIPESWKEEDEKARGGKMTLHSHYNEGNFPRYTGVQLPGGPNNSPWRVVCEAIDEDGKVWTAEATRINKQAAGNVAAWKVCVAMGLIKEDE